MLLREQLSLAWGQSTSPSRLREREAPLVLKVLMKPPPRSPQGDVTLMKITLQNLATAHQCCAKDVANNAFTKGESW